MSRRMQAAGLAVLLTGLCLCLPAKAQQAAPKPGEDPVLWALQVDLPFTKANLRLKDVPPPYYIEYSVTDMDQYVADSAFGSLRTEVRTHSRLLRAVVRVGDYKQDSYYGMGQGVIDLMPLDDDPQAMRHQIWLATDRAFKQAAEAYTSKQALLKQYQVDQPVDDFARVSPVQSVGPVASLELGGRDWRALLDSVSGLYRQDPEVHSFESSLRFLCVNRYFVNTEGTVTREGRSLYQLSVAGSSQAADGMTLNRSHGYVTASAAELPSDAEFRAFAGKLLGTLKALREAPLVDDEYRGPVLFAPDASGDIFDVLVARNILGVRPRPGEPARTVGQYASSYKSPVLPAFLTLVDDPTQAAFRGRKLVGSYAVDDEGVRAAPLVVVDKGVLVNYLVGRQPIRDFPASNGHGRMFMPGSQYWPAPFPGNLLVSSSQSMSPDELKKKLIEICQERGLAYGYYAETLGPRLAPRLLYRVYAKDGHEELVRGAEFGELDTRALRTDVLAAGNDATVQNRVDPMPVSVVAPSLLFGELEVKRSNAAKDKLPQYPPPPLSAEK